MDLKKLREELENDEGVRLKLYKDSLDIQTIGIGFNLQDPGLYPEEIDFIYENRVSKVFADLDRALPWWVTLSEPRQRVLANMCYNMGIKRLLGFHHMLDAAKAGNFESAAEEMRHSAWFDQVGPRAVRLKETFRTGV